MHLHDGAMTEKRCHRSLPPNRTTTAETGSYPAPKPLSCPDTRTSMALGSQSIPASTGSASSAWTLGPIGYLLPSWGYRGVQAHAGAHIQNCHADAIACLHIRCPLARTHRLWKLQLSHATHVLMQNCHVDCPRSPSCKAPGGELFSSAHAELTCTCNNRAAQLFPTIVGRNRFGGTALGHIYSRKGAIHPTSPQPLVPPGPPAPAPSCPLYIPHWL